MKTNLSARQESLLRLGSGLEQSTVHAAFDVRGVLDVENLRRCATALAARTEALRTFFRSVEDRHVRLVARDALLPIPVTDLADPSTPHSWLTANAVGGIDVATAPLCRLSLCRISEDHHVLLAVMHRAIAGDTTPGALVGDLFTDYSSGAPASPVPRLGQLIAAEQDLLDGAEGQAAVERWAVRLTGAPLPVRQSQEPLVSAATDLPELLCAAVGQEDPAVPVLAALSTLIHRLTGQPDLVIGLSDATADRVPVRIDLAGDPSFRELTGRVRTALRDAMSDGDIPFEVIVRRLHGDGALDVRHAQLVIENTMPSSAVTRLASVANPANP